MTTTRRILLVDENPRIMFHLEEELKKNNFSTYVLPKKVLLERQQENLDFDLALVALRNPINKSFNQSIVRTLRQYNSKKPIYGLGIFTENSQDMQEAKTIDGLEEVIPYIPTPTFAVIRMIGERLAQ